MIAQRSPLVWQHFAVLRWDYEFIEPKTQKKKINPADLFNQYKINADFAHQHKSEEDHQLRVFVKLDVNNGEDQLAGYRISIETVGFFKVDSEVKLDDATGQNLAAFAPVNMLIGRIRSIIAQFTGLAPFGTYELPVLDLNDLFKKKSQAGEIEGKKAE